MIKQKIEVNGEFDDIIEFQNQLSNIIELKIDEEDKEEILQKYLTDRVYCNQLLQTLVMITRSRPLLLPNIINFISEISGPLKQFFSTSEIIFYFSFNLSVIYHLLSLKLITFDDLMKESIYRTTDFFIFFAPEIEENDPIHYSSTFNNSYYFQVFRKNNDNESIQMKRKSGMNQTQIARIIANDDVEALQVLMSQGNIDLNYQIQKSEYETNEFMIKLKAQITIIEYAAFLGSVTVFKFLLLRGAALNPLIAELATAGGNADIIHLLEQQHVQFNNTCLDASISCHRNEVFEYIHSNFNTQFKLHHIVLSIKYYNFFCFNFILSENPSLFCDNENVICDMLFVSCYTGNREILSFLFNFININEYYKISKTKDLFQISCISGYAEIVKYLLTIDEIKKNFLNHNSENSLHRSSFYGNLDIVKLLVNSHLYDINQPSKLNETALHCAVNKGHFKIVEFFVKEYKSEVNINCVSKAWMTPIMIAAEKGFYEIVVLLSNCDDIDLNYKDFSGRTVLHIAAINGHSQIVSYLINLNGIELNSIDKNGSSPLHLAVQANKIPVIKILVEKKGVNLDLRDQAIFNQFKWNFKLFFYFSL